jgi:hypothetical protein
MSRDDLDVHVLGLRKLSHPAGQYHNVFASLGQLTGDASLPCPHSGVLIHLEIDD